MLHTHHLIIKGALGFVTKQDWVECVESMLK
jgi:hypothetical protein